MLVVIKPLRILLFIALWNILCGFAILLNGSLGPIRTPGGYLGFAVAGAFAAFSGLAPVVSLRIRQRWCRPGADCEEGRFGLVLLGLIGSAFMLIGFGSFLFNLGDFTLPPVLAENGIFILVIALFVLIFVFGVKWKKNRTTIA